MGLNHFMDVDTMAGYAEFKGAPGAALLGDRPGLVLVLGGLGVAAGAFRSSRPAPSPPSCSSRP